VRGDADLRTLKWRQKEAGPPINLFGDKMLFLAFEVDRLCNDRHGDFLVVTDSVDGLKWG